MTRTSAGVAGDGQETDEDAERRGCGEGEREEGLEGVSREVADAIYQRI